MGMIHAHRTAMSVLRAGLAALLGGALQVLGGCNAPPAKPELKSEHAGEAASALTEEQCLYYDINGKVTICHYTGSESHPYTIVRTSEQGCINGFAGQPNDYVAVGDPSCQGGGCLAVNGPCDDTLPCCDGLVCSNNVCKDLCAGVTCTASDQCHEAGTCDWHTGLCSNPAKSDGSACNDGNACTQADACQAGVCAGSNPVTCAASDQCHAAGTCNPVDGQCSNPVAPDGTGCIDGDACTQTDTCQAGVCTGSNPLACVNGICVAGANSSACQCSPFWSGPSCDIRAMVPDAQCITYQRSGTGAWSDTTIAPANLGTAAGTDPTLTVGTVNGNENRILLQVAVAPNEVPPMLQLVSATLQLSISELGNTNPIFAYSALVPWDETTTWTSFYANPEPQTGALPVSMANLWPGDTLAFFDVSDYAYSIGQGTLSKGLLLTQGGDGATTFSSSDVIPDSQPQLQICYIPDLCEGVTCTCTSGPCACDPMTGLCPGEGG